MKLLTQHLKSMAILAIAISGLLTSLTVQAQAIRDVSAYNFMVGENLNGYDPVSYFPEGGGQPLVGQQNIKLDYMGITYFFASVQNQEQFLTNPNKYEPTYGQWCAFAMASGSYVPINPLEYTISGNRLHFFVSRRAKLKFDFDIATFESKADEQWKILSNEDPRK